MYDALQQNSIVLQLLIAFGDQRPTLFCGLVKYVFEELEVHSTSEKVCEKVSRNNPENLGKLESILDEFLPEQSETDDDNQSEHHSGHSETEHDDNPSEQDESNPTQKESLLLIDVFPDHRVMLYRKNDQCVLMHSSVGSLGLVNGPFSYKRWIELDENKKKPGLSVATARMMVKALIKGVIKSEWNTSLLDQLLNCSFSEEVVKDYAEVHEIKDLNTSIQVQAFHVEFPKCSEDDSSLTTETDIVHIRELLKGIFLHAESAYKFKNPKERHQFASESTQQAINVLDKLSPDEFLRLPREKTVETFNNLASYLFAAFNELL